MRRVCFLLFYSLTSISFAAINCSNPSTGVERLICTSSRASVAHEDMALSYNLAMRRGVDINELQRSQIDWYDNVLNQCNDVSCVVDAMTNRSADIENMDGLSK